MNKTSLAAFICLFFLLVSCTTKNKADELNYMQNVEQIATEISLKNTVSTIQKGDQLMIFVSAKDMDVVRPFNQSYYSNQTGPTANAVASAEKNYLVDSEGNIDFPVLGKINTTGKTPEELKAELQYRISNYVKNPSVTLRLANFKVTVLGEIARPGQYTIADGQGTLLNAIGMAGDLTMYAKRDNILVVRNENGQITKERINLQNADFINSTYYSLKQGDVIYVSGNETKEKMSRLDPNTNIYIAIAGMVIGLTGVFVTIFKN
ncbi:MAG: polysaccharide biosynthesis/export family protein [Bergeyella sp.]